MVGGDATDVVPAPEAGVDHVVGQRRESAITRRREGRQDMDTVEDTVERAFEQIAKGTQVAAERIGIRQELGTWCDGIGSSGCHPFTEPWSRAAMTCRWKMMKTSSVGTRMMIVPALRSGMSVA